MKPTVPFAEVFGSVWDKSWIIQFTNCKILRGHALVDDDLWVRSGVVLNPRDVFYKEKRRPHFQVDCGGAILSYGFIDLQINGAFGVDFSECARETSVEDGLRKVAKGLLAHGVVAFCPTIITSPKEVYHEFQRIPTIKTRGGTDGAAILGFHYEGPFISPHKKGAHPPQHLLSLENGRKDVEEVYGSDLSNVAIVTLAPELPGSIDAVNWLTSKGVLVSVGHSTSNLTEAEEAVNHGARLITHLFNAMPPFHHRDPGLVGLLASSKLSPGKRVFFGIISDGIHTHPAALRIAYRADFEGLILVTDAVPSMGLPDGEYEMGAVKLVIKGERATVKGTETLAGSIASLDKCVRRFKKSSRCSTVEALEAASKHPAEALGLYPKMGALEAGSQADFVALCPESLSVWATFIEGRCVFGGELVSRFVVHDLRGY